MKTILENWREFEGNTVKDEAIEILSDIAYAPEAASLPKELQMRIMKFLEKNGMPTLHEENE